MDTICKDEAAKTKEDDFSDLPLFQAKEHAAKFVPSDYLEAFYKTSAEDVAMRVILFFLPGIICRLPPDNENMLDLGAGPTVYVPIAMRHRVRNIYSSDYAKVNRDTVMAWIKKECAFDWNTICEWIGTIEATSDSPAQMQELARSKMRAVLEVNVFEEKVVRGVHYQTSSDVIPAQFDVVATVFCLEYATETYDEYRKAVKNALTLVKPGGYFVQGGVLQADEYAFGGRRFKCHYLTREHILTTLSESGMCTTEGADFHLIEHEEVFILVSKKLG